MKKQIVSLDIIKPDITEIDGKHIKIEGLAINNDDLDKGAVVDMVLLGNQIKIPNSVYKIKIEFEEE